MSGSHILLTGASGYVGGTILDTLINCTEPSIQPLSFDLLVRAQDQAQKLRERYGNRVNPVVWKGFDDTESIANIAERYDIIINTGSAFHPDAARAFVDGLSRRLGDAAHPTPWMLHIAGCTNISDRPITDKAYPDREWDDALAEDIYEFMKAEDERDPYLQRTTEVGVLAASEQTGVQVVSVNAPCIFGEGRGLFNRQGLVIPIYMRYIIEHGYGYKINETGNFDWVHVEDLADLYVLLLRNILERKDRGVGYIPSGKKGIIFPAVGRALHVEIMQMCLDAAFGAGVLPREDTPKEKEIRRVGLREIADEALAGMVQIAEAGGAGHKKMKGTMARKLLGWNPTRLEEAWKRDFLDELVAIREGRRGETTIESCVAAKKTAQVA